MKYRVTTSNGTQTEVESDLSISEFAKSYSPSTDILPIPALEPEPIPAFLSKPTKGKKNAVEE